MMANVSSSLHYLQLQAAQGVGAAAQRSVLRYIAQNEMELGEFLALHEAAWREAGLAEEQIEALKSTEPVVQEWERRLQKMEVQVLGYLDENYPERLKKVLGNQAPPVLYIWGNIDLLKSPGVGFCGSRDTSEKGLQVARDAAEQVSRKNWNVVSGHARGIDITTHIAALESGGKTIIVIPEGFFFFRFREELRRLVTRENTLVVSEFQPNSKWSVANAMTRNHTICGLSNALVVIQAGLSGGTFEAGKFALKVKVPLFVADYVQPDLDGPGNPFFLARGAKPVRRSKTTQRANLTDLFDHVERHHSNPEKTALSEPLQGKLFPDDEPF